MLLLSISMILSYTFLVNESGVVYGFIINFSLFVNGNPNLFVFSNSFLFIYLISCFLELIA